MATENDKGIEMTKQQTDFMKELLGGLNNEITRQAQRIAKLEQELAAEKKAAGHWMEQSCKDHNRAEKLEQQLSRYQGGVEVEGYVTRSGLLELDDILPATLDSQRVCVLVYPQADKRAVALKEVE